MIARIMEHKGSTFASCLMYIFMNNLVDCLLLYIMTVQSNKSFLSTKIVALYADHT